MFTVFLPTSIIQYLLHTASFVGSQFIVRIIVQRGIRDFNDQVNVFGCWMFVLDPLFVKNDVRLGFVEVLDADWLINRDLVAFFRFVDKDVVRCFSPIGAMRMIWPSTLPEGARTPVSASLQYSAIENFRSSGWSAVTISIAVPRSLITVENEPYSGRAELEPVAA